MRTACKFQVFLNESDVLYLCKGKGLSVKRDEKKGAGQRIPQITLYTCYWHAFPTRITPGSNQKTSIVSKVLIYVG